jgi:hypothetical protein
MSEFRVGDYTYRCRKMNLRSQFHVARKLAPLLGHVALMQAMQGSLGQGDIGALGAMLVPFAEALAKASTEDCDFVLDQCLGTVQRNSGGNGQSVWTDIWAARANRMQFEDIDLRGMLEISVEVLKDNLGGFFNAPTEATDSPSPATASTALSS